MEIDWLHKSLLFLVVLGLCWVIMYRAFFLLRDKAIAHKRSEAFWKARSREHLEHVDKLSKELRHVIGDKEKE